MTTKTTTFPPHQTCYYLLLNPDAPSMEFMLSQKRRAAQAGIPERYTQTSKPHITLVSWEDKPEEDERMTSGLSNLLQQVCAFRLLVGDAAIVGPQWGKHLIVSVEASQGIADLVAGLKKQLPGGRKGKLHLTLAYKVPGDKIPATLSPEDFHINSRLGFDSFTLLKYTADRKYVTLGEFHLDQGPDIG